MTEKELELYNAIEKFIKEKGYSPTIRELCKIVNNNSSATVFTKLRKIKNKGYIIFDEKKSRTIRVI